MIYRCMKTEPTPQTHPELFDPKNPPAGWSYDEWHAFWYEHPSERQIAVELSVMKISLWVTLGLMAWIAIAAIYSLV
jgi:hypothetical protein